MERLQAVRNPSEIVTSRGLTARISGARDGTLGRVLRVARCRAARALPAAYGKRLGVGEGPLELTARVLLVPLLYQAD